MSNNKKELPILQWNSDLTAMSSLLIDDLKRVIAETEKNAPDQYLRRSFVRTLFATIEGCLNSHIRAVLLFHKTGVINLDEDNTLIFQSATRN